MSFINYYLILIFMINLGVKSQTGQVTPELNKDYPGISCGKPNPKKEKDCTKYGTDSGMLCCWVAGNKEDINGKCTLFSQKTAEEFHSFIDILQLGHSFLNSNHFSKHSV